MVMLTEWLLIGSGLYLFGSWIHMTFDPVAWSIWTRISVVVILVFLIVISFRPQQPGGGKGRPRGG